MTLPAFMRRAFGVDPINIAERMVTVDLPAIGRFFGLAPAVMPPRGPVHHGAQFGRLTAIACIGSLHHARVWLCHCLCGRIVPARASDLGSGQKKSCGCLKRVSSQRTHGRAGTPLFRIWHDMHRRCTDPRRKNFRNYGGRGVTVCERWTGPNGFAAFLSDMGERPSLAHSLDRIDSNGHYEPGNVRWATDAEQNRNRDFVKLNPVSICLIRHMRRRGAFASDIGHAFGVAAAHVSAICHQQAWVDQWSTMEAM